MNDNLYYLENPEEYNEFKEWKRKKESSKFQARPEQIPLIEVKVSNLSEIVISHLGLQGSPFGDVIEEKVKDAS